MVKKYSENFRENIWKIYRQSLKFTEKLEVLE